MQGLRHAQTDTWKSRGFCYQRVEVTKADRSYHSVLSLTNTQSFFDKLWWQIYGNIWWLYSLSIILLIIFLINRLDVWSAQSPRWFPQKSYFVQNPKRFSLLSQRSKDTRKYSDLWGWNQIILMIFHKSFSKVVYLIVDNKLITRCSFRQCLFHNIMISKI